jgi:hypothetical protein
VCACQSWHKLRAWVKGQGCGHDSRGGCSPRGEKLRQTWSARECMQTWRLREPSFATAAQWNKGCLQHTGSTVVSQ